MALLDQPSAVKSTLLGALSPEERARAHRFHAPRDRDRYVVAHGAMRDILGCYLGLAPADVRLDAAPNGKPVLAPELRRYHLEFNLSHSHELALIAVGSGRRVGIDVERIRSEVRGETIAEHFFSPPETALLRALPPDARLAAFFAGWTRKEAYSKARGEGLRKPFDQFAVVIAPDQPATLLYDGSDPRAPAHWSLRSLDVGSAYAAAVAVEGHDWRLRRWLWSTPVCPR
jgi:4'-phosphopantetheinyl transferase